MDYKAKAVEAIANGYPRGNLDEVNLRRHMERHLPKMTEELGEDLTDFLIVRVERALEMIPKLMEQGLGPMEARNEAMREMYPLGEDDELSETLQPETSDTPTM